METMTKEVATATKTERLNYTLVVVNNARILKCVPDYCFDTREEAERWAEGITIGTSIVGKKCGVMMLLNGKYDYTTAISKNLTSKQGDVLWRGLRSMDAKNLWERISLADIDFDKYLPGGFWIDVLKFSEKWEGWITDTERRNKWGCKTGNEVLNLLTKFF